MTKQELISSIRKEISPSQAWDHVPAVVEAFMSQVKKEVAAGQRIDLRGFGSFSPITRKAKVGRSGPGLKVRTVIPPKVVVKFKPSDAFTDMLQRLVP